MRWIRAPICPVLWGAVVAISSIAATVADAAVGSRSAELERKTARFIEQLDDQSRKARRLAERELLALGPGILPFLPPPELLPSVSVREAVRRIRIRLEQTKARNSVLPSRVTLEDTLPLGELLAAVTRQTGNRVDSTLVPADLLRKPITVRFRQRPFWPVVDRLAASAGLVSDRRAPADILKLKPAKPESKPTALAVAYSGAFRLAVLSATLRPLFGDEHSRLLRVRLGLQSEPRLRPLFVKFSGKDVAAVTSANRLLEPFNPAARYELPLGEQGRRLQLQLDFKVPVSLKLSEARLRGKLIVETAAGTEKIAFKNLTAGQRVARRRGGVTVTLEQVSFRETTDREHVARVQVAVSYDTGGPAFESHRTWIFHNRAYLETADGRRIERNAQFHTRLRTDGGIAVEYNFEHLEGSLETYRFVYVAPTLVINVPVEFLIPTFPVSRPATERKQP